MLHSLLPIRDRKKLLTMYRNSFSAKEAFDTLLSNRIFNIQTYDQAVNLCQSLIRNKFIIRAHASENKAITALPSNVLSHRENFSESPDSLYQFTTLAFSEDPSEKAKRRAEQEALARTQAAQNNHRGSLSRIDNTYEMSKNSVDRRGTVGPKEETPVTSSGPVLSIPGEQTTVLHPPTPNSTSTPHPPLSSPPNNVRKISRGKKLEPLDNEESKVAEHIFEKPDFSGISSDSYIAPHTAPVKHLGQSIGKTPGGINIRVNVKQTGSASTLPRNPNLKINVKPTKEYNVWYKDWCGFLEKKRDKGLNVSWYQRRYFRLEVDSRALVYYSSPDETFPLGFIPLHDINTLHYVPDKKNGRKFDIFTYGRVYSLKAESTDEATQWVAALTACIQHLHLGQAVFAKRRPPPQPKTPKTPIMMRFFSNPKNPLDIINSSQTNGSSTTLALASARRNSFSTVSRNSVTKSTVNPILYTPEYLRGLVDEHGRSKVDSYQEFKMTGSVRYRPKINMSLPLTTLRYLFYQLHFSVSTLREPNHFRQLMDQFQTDDEILQYFFEILLTDTAAGSNNRNNSIEFEDNAEQSAGNDKEDKYAVNARTTDNPDEMEKMFTHRLNKQKVDVSNMTYYADDVPYYKRRHKRSDSASSLEIAGSLYQGWCPSRILPSIHDITISPLPNLIPFTLYSQCPEAQSVVQENGVQRPRSKSDPGVEPVANVKETNFVVADTHTKREHLIYRLSSNTNSRTILKLSMHEKTKTWLTSSYFYDDVVCGPYFRSYERLILPLFWTLLLYRHHNEAVSDDIEDEDIYESDQDPDSNIEPNSNNSKLNGSTKYNFTINSSNSLLNNTSILGLLRHMKNSQQSPPLIRTQKHMFTNIAHCVVAREFVDWLVKFKYCERPEEAVAIGNLLVSHGVFYTTSTVRKFKLNSGLWAVQDIAGLIGLLENIDSPFKEKRWGNMVEDGQVFGINSQNRTPSGNENHSPNNHVDSINSLQALPGSVARLSPEETSVMLQRLQGSWLNSISLAQLITGLSPDHWRTKWMPTCKACQGAAAHFTELVSRLCSFFSYDNPVVDVMTDEERELNPFGEGSGMSLVTTNSILSILVTPACEMPFIQSPVRDEFSVFSRAVQNAGVWRALFTGLYATAPHLRRRALQHVSGLMVCMPQGSENALSLSIVPCWADWVLSMLDDSDAQLRVKDKVRDKVFKFAMNIIAMVLHELFISKDCAQDEDTSTSTEGAKLEWAAPMLATQNERVGPSQSVLRQSVAYERNGIEMVDPKLTLAQPQDLGRTSQYNHGISLLGGPSTVNVNSLDVDIMTTNTNPNLAPCIYPHRRAGFTLPLSVVGAASIRRPKCYKAQLLDSVLAGLSRSTVKDYSLSRTILTAQVIKISSKLRSRYSIPIHERLSQLSFLMQLIRSFVFQVPLSPDGDVYSTAHITTLHIPATAFQLQSHVYTSQEDAYEDILSLAGNLLQNDVSKSSDPTYLRKAFERLQLFSDNSYFNSGVHNFGYCHTPSAEEFLQTSENSRDQQTYISSPISSYPNSKENSQFRRSGRGRRLRRDSYSQTQFESSRTMTASLTGAGRTTFTTDLSTRQSIHVSRRQMQHSQIGSHFHGQSTNQRSSSTSRKTLNAKEKTLTMKQSLENDKEQQRQEKLKEEQFKQAGGGLHWREKQGVEEDIDLIEKAIGLLRQLHLVEAPLLNIGAFDDDVNMGGNTKAKDALRTNPSKSDTGKDSSANTRAPPQEIWTHLNMLAGHYADERPPTPQECEYIRRIQNIGDFFKESLTFLYIIKER